MGLLGEVVASLGLHDALERLDEVLQVLGAELGICLHATLLTQLLERVLEEVAGDVEHDLAEHLDEAAVRVVGEALVVGLLRQPADGRVVEPEVEDRVHHPGHRERRTGAHGHEERVGVVAEALAHLLLERRERLGDLVHQAVGQHVVGVHVRVAGLGGDREAGRDRQAELGHLGEVGALAAEQELLLLRALFEGVDVLHDRSPDTWMKPETTDRRRRPTKRFMNNSRQVGAINRRRRSSRRSDRADPGGWRSAAT